MTDEDIQRKRRNVSGIKRRHGAFDAYFLYKDLLRINLYILLVWFSDLFVRKPRRTPVRLRFLP